jgi:hypothetical protein
MPNFLIIGATKSATTSLFMYLGQHPQVYLPPVKEPNFFNSVGLPKPADYRPQRGPIRKIYDLAEYQALFADAPPGALAVGEATPNYLRNPYAARQIHAHIPAARLIASLRQPADRAYSHFLMNASQMKEDRPFEEIARAEMAAIGPLDDGGREPEAFLPYLYAGLYHRHLTGYYALFSRAQVRVLLYDDIAADAPAAVRGLFEFLGVDPRFPVDTSERAVASFAIKRRGAFSLLKKIHIGRILRRVLPGGLFRRVRRAGLEQLAEKAPPLDPALRRELTEYFRPEILRLQDLLGRDLTPWLA